MTSKLMSMSDKAIQARVVELEGALLDENGKLENARKVSYLAPVLQMYTSELSARFAKRTTIAALWVSGLSLLVSGAALYVSYHSGSVP